MPPDCLNQRVPTATLTPHAAAASSVDNPVATQRQNPRSTSRPKPGRPGERITGRPVTLEAQPLGRPIRTSNGALQRPVETTQYTSLAFTEKLLDLGLTPSIGRVGTAYDNALIESTIGLYKTELVHRRAYGWDGRADVELATARWVAWFNHQRLHEHLGYNTPIEIEEAYIHQQGLPRQAA